MLTWLFPPTPTPPLPRRVIVTAPKRRSDAEIVQTFAHAPGNGIFDTTLELLDGRILDEYSLAGDTAQKVEETWKALGAAEALARFKVELMELARAGAAAEDGKAATDGH